MTTRVQPSERVGRERRETHPVAELHRHVGPHPEVDHGRRRESATREPPQLHGGVAAVIGPVAVGARAGPGEPRAVRVAPEWRGDATRAWRVEAVWGETYMPANSSSDSKPALNVRGAVLVLLEDDVGAARVPDTPHDARALIASSAAPTRRPSIDEPYDGSGLSGGEPLATLIALGDVAQLARAPALQAGGRGFESHRLHHLSCRETLERDVSRHRRHGGLR